MALVLKVENLTKRYNGVTAVDHISFELAEGEIVGLLGPNGAGKTTTIQLLLSLVEPSEGHIEIFGEGLANNREKILEKVNFSAPYAALPYNLTVYENLVVFSLLYGVRERREKIETLLSEFRLVEFRNQRTGALSSGEQTRLGLAKAFLNDPKLLLLDEPTASLDPAIAQHLRALVCQKMKSVHGAILWTSHNMREVEMVCDRIIFLSLGKIIERDTIKNLQDRYKKRDLEELFIFLAQ